jgi:4-alpha-glucanotransferase
MQKETHPGVCVPNSSAWGIDEKYRDDSGQWHAVSDATKNKFLSAMQATQEGPADAPLLVVRQGADVHIPESCELQLEDGTRVRATDKLPPDLPLGYHSIFDREGRESRLIVTPPRCFLPSDLHTWGWALQLYSLRSQSSWGMGDLEDLRRMCEWSAELGAGIVMVNPLCAPAPVLPQQTSPYYPSSRLFLSPLYLSIETIAGAREALPDLDKLCEEGRALNDKPLIERDAIYGLKMRTLEKMWSRMRDKLSFADFERSRGAICQLLCTCRTIWCELARLATAISFAG